MLPKKYEYAKILNSRYPYEYFNGFSSETKRILGNLLKSIVEGEKITEQKRKILSSNIGFSSYECFEMMKNKYSSAIFKDDVNILILIYRSQGLCRKMEIF